MLAAICLARWVTAIFKPTASQSLSVLSAKDRGEPGAGACGATPRTPLFLPSCVPRKVTLLLWRKTRGACNGLQLVLDHPTATWSARSPNSWERRFSHPCMAAKTPALPGCRRETQGMMPSPRTVNHGSISGSCLKNAGRCHPFCTSSPFPSLTHSRQKGIGY